MHCYFEPFHQYFRHANLPAFGRILPLSRCIPAIPHGIHEIPLYKAILRVTESSKIAHFLSPKMDSFMLKMHQTRGRPGLLSGPCWGAYDAASDPLGSWGGDLLLIPSHLSAFVISNSVPRTLRARADPSFSF